MTKQEIKLIRETLRPWLKLTDEQRKERLRKDSVLFNKKETMITSGFR